MRSLTVCRQKNGWLCFSLGLFLISFVCLQWALLRFKRATFSGFHKGSEGFMMIVFSGCFESRSQDPSSDALLELSCASTGGLIMLESC